MNGEDHGVNAKPLIGLISNPLSLQLLQLQIVPVSKAIVRIVFVLELEQSFHIWAEQIIHWLRSCVWGITSENMYHNVISSYQRSWRKCQHPSYSMPLLPLESDDISFQGIRDISHPALGFVTLLTFRN